MRKLVALLLALCLMCGAWVLAGAEDDTQTCEALHYVYEVPVGWYAKDLESHDDGDHFYHSGDWRMGDAWYEREDWLTCLEMVDVSFESWEGVELIGSNYDFCMYGSLKEAFADRNYIYVEQPYTYSEKVLPNGDRVACGIADYEAGYLMCKGSLCVQIKVSLSFSGYEDMAAAIHEAIWQQVVSPIFTSVRPVGSEKAEAVAAAPIQDVAVEGKQVFRIGDATFQVDPDLVVEDQNEMVIQASNALYQMELAYIDWTGNGIAINFTGDNQYDHLVYYWVLNGSNVQEAMSIAGLASDMACDMPDGDIVKLIINEAGVMFSHYFDGKGIVMLLMPKDSEAADELIMIGVEVMKSFRVDGITEEDMRAAAEAAAAARAEAEAQAAAEAAAQKYVVITADSGKIRTEASISGGLIKTAYKGESYVLLREEGDWYVVEVDGRTGYIHSGVAEIQ